MGFVNRESEIQHLTYFFHNEPNALLFMCPKSIGKSTLLNRYAINFLDLREMLIYAFHKFFGRTFPETLSPKVKAGADEVTFAIGFLGINLDDESLLKHKPFKVMGDKLHASQHRGKQPVIVIDELHMTFGVTNPMSKKLRQILRVFTGHLKKCSKTTLQVTHDNTS